MFWFLFAGFSGSSLHLPSSLAGRGLSLLRRLRRGPLPARAELCAANHPTGGWGRKVGGLGPARRPRPHAALCYKRCGIRPLCSKELPEGRGGAARTGGGWLFRDDTKQGSRAEVGEVELAGLVNSERAHCAAALEQSHDTGPRLRCVEAPYRPRAIVGEEVGTPQCPLGAAPVDVRSHR